MQNRLLHLVVLLSASSASVAQAQSSVPTAPGNPAQPAGNFGSPYAPTAPPPGGGPVEGGGACWGPELGIPGTEPAGQGGRFWVSGEYLLWWIRNSNVPPLVTTSSPASAGILGKSDTVVLFGGSIENDVHSGGRFQAGYWLDGDRTVGIEGGYFFLGSRSVGLTTGGPNNAGGGTIARPLFNAVTGMQDSQLVAQPGQLNGTVGVSLSSSLQGAELNGVCNLGGGCYGRVDVLAGFRWLELSEGLGVNENLAVPAGIPIIAGTTFQVNDQFTTRNWFYGGQVGARGEVRWQNFFVNVLGKVALGDTHQVIEVAGNTVIGAPGVPPRVGSGGLLALPSNGGRFSRDEFAVVPEVGINVGYQLGQYLRVFLGYSFVYWSNVVRPGDQVDLTVNPTQLPTTSLTPQLVGAPRPQPLFRDTDFWAQGVSFGLEFRY
jgi:hypothetical protein